MKMWQPSLFGSADVLRSASKQLACSKPVKHAVTAAVTPNLAQIAATQKVMLGLKGHLTQN